MEPTAGSWADEKERPDGVNAKGSCGEHEAGKDDAALPLESLQTHSQCHSAFLSLIRVNMSLPTCIALFWTWRPAKNHTSNIQR